MAYNPQAPNMFVYGGNPNGNVAGNTGVANGAPPDLCYDNSNGYIYVCTVSGNAASAVWVIKAATIGTAALNVVQLDASANMPNVSGIPGVAGSVRNAIMSVAAASATATFTADEIIVATALNGVFLRLSSYSKSINLAITGAGGMDTGSAPVSGYVSLYAIAKPDGTSSILACNVTTSTATIYAGANMPAGYTYSALIGTWPTNASSQFPIGYQTDRFVSIPLVAVLSAGTQTTYTSVSISSAVPPNAKVAIGAAEANYVSAAAQVIIAADVNGTGFTTVDGIPSQANHAFMQCPIVTSQTLYYKTGNAGCTAYIFVTGYLF